MRLFNEIKRRLGNVQMIAEDLGVLDSGVIRLRERTGFPGMKILQFAFDNNLSNPYLPHNIEKNSVVYTGTHDNDTTLGFLNEMDEEQFIDFKKQLRSALKSENAICPFASREEAALAMIVCAFASNANTAIIPIQDIMNLDASARMNVPSTSEGNWQYRMEKMPSRRDVAILRKAIGEYRR